MENNFIKPNKLTNDTVMTLKKRTWIVFAFVFYFAILIFLSFLADDSISKWSATIIPSVYDRGIIAIFYLLFLSVPLFFGIYETNKLIFGKNKISFAILSFVSFLFFVGPNLTYIIFDYFYDKLQVDPSLEQNGLNILYVFNTCIVVLGIVMFVAVNITLKAYNKFVFANFLCLNFLILVISFGMMSLGFIGLVRSWITLIFILFLTSGTDVFCYLFGLLFGKHKMAPVISPKKTWEGAIFGSLAAFAFALGYAGALTADPSQEAFIALVGLRTSENFQWMYITLIIIIVIVSSIAGDLIFSFIKRSFKIKDFSTMLGPHGGFLDRFDSMFVSSSVFTLGLFFAVAVSSSTLFSI